jgi:hypothetical protein
MPDVPGPSRLRRPLLGGALAGVVLALLWHAGNVLFGPNLHTVLPGAVYRCSQPSAAGLERLVRRYGIRTVVNMRGYCDPIPPWYSDEARVTARLGVSLEDLGFSAGRLPSAVTLRHLLDVLDRSERPILIHCHKGADRTGLASTLAVLLYTDASLPEARRHLEPRMGHLPIGRTIHMDRFFDLYAEWLAAEGVDHAPDHLRRWIRHGYCGGAGRATIEVILPRGAPLKVPRDQPFSVRVRCHNTSVKPWHFQPGSNAGTHVKYVVLDEEEDWAQPERRGGLLFATVEPGEHIDVTLPVGALRGPGRYVLRVDLMDEQQGSFVQLGSEPLFCELEVL